MHDYISCTNHRRLWNCTVLFLSFIRQQHQIAQIEQKPGPLPVEEQMSESHRLLSLILERAYTERGHILIHLDQEINIADIATLSTRNGAKNINLGYSMLGSDWIE